MPLLVIAPLLAFIVVVLLFFAVRMAEGRDNRPVRFVLSTSPPADRAGKSFSTIHMSDAFEPGTSMLWDTQIDALEVIYSAGRDGVCAEQLRPFYLRSARRYPELYDGSDFNAWLEFLEEAGLVKWTGPVVRISTAGVAFLKCHVVADAGV